MLCNGYYSSLALLLLQHPTVRKTEQKKEEEEAKNRLIFLPLCTRCFGFVIKSKLVSSTNENTNLILIFIPFQLPNGLSSHCARFDTLFHPFSLWISIIISLRYTSKKKKERKENNHISCLILQEPQQHKKKRE